MVMKKTKASSLTNNEKVQAAFKKVGINAEAYVKPPMGDAVVNLAQRYRGTSRAIIRYHFPAHTSVDVVDADVKKRQVLLSFDDKKGVEFEVTRKGYWSTLENEAEAADFLRWQGPAGAKFKRVKAWDKKGGTAVFETTSDEDRHFLIGRDDTRSMFICQLPRRCSSIDDSYDALTPEEVKDALAAGQDVRRQGEFFAVKMDSDTLPAEVRKVHPGPDEREWRFDRTTGEGEFIFVPAELALRKPTRNDVIGDLQGWHLEDSDHIVKGVEYGKGLYFQNATRNPKRNGDQYIKDATLSQSRHEDMKLDGLWRIFWNEEVKFSETQANVGWD